MQISITRGPQIDKTDKFEVKPGQSNYPVNFKFSRSSGFQYDSKTNEWQKKTLQFEIHYSALDKLISAGTIDLDICGYVDKGKCTN